MTDAPGGREITMQETTTASATLAQQRMAPVLARTQQIRRLFEVEKAFIMAATALVPRCGEPELKYRLTEHAWESAQHARFLRDRGRELPGYDKHDLVRPEIWRIFDEAIRVGDRDGLTGLAAIYGVLKPALLDAYRHYLAVTEALGDWPTTKLIEEYIGDELRHAAEMDRFLAAGPAEPETQARAAHAAHIASALSALGGWLQQDAPTSLPTDFNWLCDAGPYQHSRDCNRGAYPTCGSGFGFNPDEDIIVPELFTDPTTDPRVIRLLIYVWLFNEMDAVDYLATVLVDTPGVPFDCHYDLTRHLWDEARHSQFGYRALPRLGIDLMEVEQQLALYSALVRMQPHERYALMTQQFEAGSFEIKALIMDRVRQLGDFEADTLLAFDRNDEQHHVRYGTRWLPTLMEAFGVTTPIKEWLPDVQQRFGPIVTAETERLGHTLPLGKRLTARRVLDMIAAQS